MIFAIVGGAIALGLTIICTTPTYQSVTKIYVNNADISVGNISVSASDISTSGSLIPLYIEILNTKKTMDIVIARADLDYNYAQLMSMVKASASNATPVMKITVTSTSPEEAHLIASTVAKVLPSELLESKNMGVLLESLAGAFDYVFIDLPPVNLVTDALCLSVRSLL